MNYADLVISSFRPKEILVQKGFEKGVKERYLHWTSNVYVSTMDEWAFVFDSSYLKLTRQLHTDTLKGFGVENLRMGITAAGALLFYLEANRLEDTEYFSQMTLA